MPIREMGSHGDQNYSQAEIDSLLDGAGASGEASFSGVAVTEAAMVERRFSLPVALLSTVTAGDSIVIRLSVHAVSGSGTVTSWQVKFSTSVSNQEIETVDDGANPDDNFRFGLVLYGHVTSVVGNTITVKFRRAIHDSEETGVPTPRGQVFGSVTRTFSNDVVDGIDVEMVVSGATVSRTFTGTMDFALTRGTVHTISVSTP